MCMHCSNPQHLSRRNMLVGGVAALSAAIVPRSVVGQATSTPPPNSIPSDEALSRIMDGNARYSAGNLANKDFSVGRAARSGAQYPIAAILSCADSRVSPELAFDQGPGELFVVRLAGNFVNDDGLASLEYGIRFLGVPLVMVLGHSNCGAVAATIKVLQDGTALPGHLPELVNSIKPAVEAAKKKGTGDLLEEATVENVRHNVQRLASAAPILSDMVQQGRVKVVGGVYDIATGKVNLL